VLASGTEEDAKPFDFIGYRGIEAGCNKRSLSRRRRERFKATRPAAMRNPAHVVSQGPSESVVLRIGDVNPPSSRNAHELARSAGLGEVQSLAASRPCRPRDPSDTLFLSCSFSFPFSLSWPWMESRFRLQNTRSRVGAA